MKKILKDLLSTLYDDLNFKCLSLPRVLVALGFLIVIIAWVAEQFFGKAFPHFQELCIFCGGGSLANFAFSKWTDLADPLVRRLNDEKQDRPAMRDTNADNIGE